MSAIRSTVFTVTRVSHQVCSRISVGASVSPRPRFRTIKVASSLTQVSTHPQTVQRRSTSWIAWEQPNPALYARPPSSEKQQAANSAQDTRPVGENVTAPASTAVVGGSQEVSTSGKTVPPTIQAGSSRTPFTQSRSLQTSTAQPEQHNSHPRLPTTLLRIPGITTTWPDTPSTHPDQKRVRKQQINDGHGTHTTKTPDPSPRHRVKKPGHAQGRALHLASRIAHRLHVLRASPDSPFHALGFQEHLDGVRARAEGEACWDGAAGKGRSGQA
ncbi:hypothetical protein GGR54DRAFT_642268 [Hypoxylon sp. NC1633]|nr:hypothetical protein GGR54DRAFT_642268 [Hypoxylon sp. NC1633]